MDWTWEFEWEYKVSIAFLHLNLKGRVGRGLKLMMPNLLFEINVELKKKVGGEGNIDEIEAHWVSGLFCSLDTNNDIF